VVKSSLPGKKAEKNAKNEENKMARGKSVKQH
jgi:hypothetical protein